MARLLVLSGAGRGDRGFAGHRREEGGAGTPALHLVHGAQLVVVGLHEEGLDGDGEGEELPEALHPDVQVVFERLRGNEEQRQPRSNVPQNLRVREASVRRGAEPLLLTAGISW